MLVSMLRIMHLSLGGGQSLESCGVESGDDSKRNLNALSATPCDSMQNDSSFAHGIDSTKNVCDSKQKHFDSTHGADSTQKIFDSTHTSHSKTSQSKGQIFICPIASSLSRLRGLDEFRGDFIALDSTLTKRKILAFYAQDFYKACDYCHDMWAQKRTIPVAIQTKEVLRLEKE